jgi:hypothetical protein
VPLQVEGAAVLTAESPGDVMRIFARGLCRICVEFSHPRQTHLFLDFLSNVNELQGRLDEQQHRLR